MPTGSNALGLTRPSRPEVIDPSHLVLPPQSLYSYPVQNGRSPFVYSPRHERFTARGRACPLPPGAYGAPHAFRATNTNN
eukprot:10994819-Heterocapsa_arctica.AAC.1